MASVALRGLRKDFGRVSVIKGIDLAIEDQEFVVFVGPSGCGKSTLLRLIAGLEERRAGDDLDRRSRGEQRRPPKDRNIAMVFQNYALYPHMTVVREHGLRPARAQGAGSRDRGGAYAAPPTILGHRCTAGPLSAASFPAASASAWRSAAPSFATPRCSCSTSRCPTSMPSCATRCGPRSRSLHQQVGTTVDLRHA